MYCLYVNVCCHRLTIQLQLTNIYHIICHYVIQVLMTGVAFFPPSFPTTIIRVFLVSLISLVCGTGLLRTKVAQSMSVYTGSYHGTDGWTDKVLTTQHVRRALNRKLKVVVSREIFSLFYSNPLGMNDDTFGHSGGGAGGGRGGKQAC
jgi:hypothetical protein